ncbi:MAG TPA: hypothetical protein VG324_19705 [Blastocatellia bacterium]|nr:hypothetical protein [Blastocatellia bacterium]
MPIVFFLSIEIFNESLPAIQIPIAIISDDDNLVRLSIGEIFSALFTREHNALASQSDLTVAKVDELLRYKARAEMESGQVAVFLCEL